jgi:hypothetical protein
MRLATTAKKLKVTLVIDAAPLVALRAVPDNAPSRTELTIAVGGRIVAADVATKSVPPSRFGAIPNEHVDARSFHWRTVRRIEPWRQVPGWNLLRAVGF